MLTCWLALETSLRIRSSDAFDGANHAAGRLVCSSRCTGARAWAGSQPIWWCSWGPAGNVKLSGRPCCFALQGTIGSFIHDLEAGIKHSSCTFSLSLPHCKLHRVLSKKNKKNKTRGKIKLKARTIGSNKNSRTQKRKQAQLTWRGVCLILSVKISVSICY